ncbi:uncharacterized protein M421DRAFT_417249 [Didymella exigua CBS 183.55]|uniref:Uncharacterized protein n=1 Tax=Didymella exigua CBS 183.55 TaxID=1150837 RepID=A0A6A5RYW9_9PLEO|nr:uncharacterized protein M421DRAFT_417249 [Didymella exigua CBS 183.55]KAF1931476.1 hypothetical protein M421DRAFT_417249 [Didymella exigua CBS 183.55]
MPMQRTQLARTETCSSLVQLSDRSLILCIESVNPYLWLPLSASKTFGKAFDLEWNEDAQMYLANSSA